MDTPASVRDLLFTLLLKVGVASSIAAIARPVNAFRRVLFTEERDPDKSSIDAVHDAGADPGCDAAARGRVSLRVCGFIAGRRLF